MLETMSPTLRHVTIAAPPSLSARRWATVLKTLCRRAPQLETLSIGCGDPSDSFPGFKPLQPVLVGRKGFAALRELWINDLGPVGREQFQELASMTISNGGLSLSMVYLGGCCCSLDDSGEECRDRAVDALKQAAPSLECTVEHYEDGCGCVGVVPPPQPPQEPPQPPQ